MYDMKWFNKYMQKKVQSTNVRVMLEICGDYRKWVSIMGNNNSPRNRSEFYNMSVDEKFKILYDHIGINWINNVLDEALFRLLLLIIIGFFVYMFVLII